MRTGLNWLRGPRDRHRSTGDNQSTAVSTMTVHPCERPSVYRVNILWSIGIVHYGLLHTHIWHWTLILDTSLKLMRLNSLVLLI